MEFIFQKKRKVKPRKCCLLIGNTRWHWAIQETNKWVFFHTAPNTNKFKSLSYQVWKWASVGPTPVNILLDPDRCIQIKDIPLLKLPPWIGIDRALVGWAAYEKAKAKNLHSQGVLIADAGTVMSITRITANGEFNGGQLVAGWQLILKAMATDTENLNEIKKKYVPNDSFPLSTEEAMLQGSFQALLGTLLEAQKQANMPLWLCGGDSKILYEHLKKFNLSLYYQPNLALEAMVNIESINEGLNLE